MKKTKVAIVHRNDVSGTPGNHDNLSRRTVSDMVREAVEVVGGVHSLVKPGDKVVVKPNAVWPVPPDAAITTDPRVVEAVIRLVKEKTDAREVILVERSAVGRKTSESLEVSGIKAAAERAGVDRIVCLEDDARVPTRINGAKALIDLVGLPQVLVDSDVLIYLPKMKTHKQVGVSLSMKLSQGMLVWSDIIRNHRTDLEQKMIDLLKVIEPNLSIIDGIWAQQGQGPGSPYPRDIIKDRNLIIAGKDPVATDAVAAATMGFEPMHDIGMIRGATLEGLGEGNIEEIEVLGESIEDVGRFFRRGTCSLAGLHAKIDAYTGGACIGCQGFTRTGLDPVLAQPELLEDIEKLTFILGFNTKVPDNLVHDPPRSYVFVIGDCAAEHKNKGIFLPGCASISVHEMLDFIGKDPEEIMRLYWEFQPRGYVA